MSFENILLAVKHQIATITINRPQKLNALNWQTMLELREAFAQVKDDDAVRGVIVTGAGEKAFVAGADIGELAQKSPLQGKDFALASQEILRGIEHFPKPVIAAVNGFCLGGGNELAMACHMRWASENAKFGQPEVNLGIICGNGGTQRLLRRVPVGMARDLVFSGRSMDADTGRRVSLPIFPPPGPGLPRERPLGRPSAGRWLVTGPLPTTCGGPGSLW